MNPFPSAAFLVPTVSVIPAGIVYALGPTSENIARVVFGALFLLLVEWTITRRLEAHLKVVTGIVERSAIVAESVDLERKTTQGRLDRFEGKIERIDTAVKAMTQHCETSHGC